jgi:integrase
VAAIYRRKDSPWCWIRCKTADGKWVATATRFRKDNALHRAKAQELAAQISQGERTVKTDHSWVLGMIESHPVRPSTRRHYINSWRHLSWFLDHHGLALEDFAPIHADQYIRWRIGIPRTNGKPVCRNLAVDDIKALKWIHRQGRLLGLMTSVKMLDYRCKKDPPAKRPVFTDEEIDRVRRFLAHENEMDPSKEWKRISFEIAYATGCRLRETRLDMRLVDLTSDTITFPEPKGGAARAYTIPIPNSLRLLLARLKQSGRRFAFDWPGYGTKVSSAWRTTFNICGLPKHTFHSLRATRVTNLRKAGVAQSVAMRLVNHSSTLVHELYQRHFVEDLRTHVNAGIRPPSTYQTTSETLPRGKSESPPPRKAGGSWSTPSRRPQTAPEGLAPG